MIVSRNEAEALALKAARGAGVPLGHAEDFARAVGYLLATTPDKASEVAVALAGPHVPVRFQIDGLTLRIAATGVVMAAPIIVDALLADCDNVVAAAVDAPALLDAALAIANAERGLRASWRWDGATCILRRDGPQRSKLPNAGQVDVQTACWDAMNAHAAATYVPESAQSRMRGAGAGKDD